MNENPFEEIVERGARKLMQQVDELPEQVPPLGAKELSADEQHERWLEIREKPEAWMQLLQKYGVEEVLRYDAEMRGIDHAES